MSKNTNSFRVGRVSVYRRRRVWYLCYHQDGHRYRSRVGPDRKAARQLAAQVNAQLEVSAPTVLAFEPISIPDLREQRLSHHEHVVRSSLATVRRYRAASDHLIRFVHDVQPIKLASQFCARHAEAFVIHLRQQVVVHTHVIGDLLIARLEGVLTAGEQQLVGTLLAEKGRELLKHVTTQLIETVRPVLELVVVEAAGVKVMSLHHDVIPLTGEEVVVFTLADSPVFHEMKKQVCRGQRQFVAFEEGPAARVLARIC